MSCGRAVTSVKHRNRDAELSEFHLTRTRQHVDSKDPHPGITTPDVDGRTPDGPYFLAEALPVDGRPQGKYAEVRRVHRRLRAGDVKVLYVAAFAGPRFQRICPSRNMIAEDVNELDIRAHQRAETFGVAILPRAPQRLFTNEQGLRVSVAARGAVRPNVTCGGFGRFQRIDDRRLGTK